MYFANYDEAGKETAGVLVADRQKIIALESIPALGFRGSLLDFIQSGPSEELHTIKQALDDVDLLNRSSRPVAAVKLLAPIRRPRRNIICLGLNYQDHIRESQSVTQEEKLQTMEYPVYFGKMAAVITGPGEEIFSHPAITAEVDYEVELALIIGKDGSNITPAAAEDYVFGYSVFNDLSARDLQRRHKQWIKGKSLDGFSVLGPYIVHKSHLPFPIHLQISSRVNGELRQNSNTKNLLFDLPTIISDLSRGFTLQAGDIIATGTPAGVGMGFSPPRYLQPGDVIELEIEKIGVLRNTLI